MRYIKIAALNLHSWLRLVLMSPVEQVGSNIHVYTATANILIP